LIKFGLLKRLWYYLSYLIGKASGSQFLVAWMSVGIGTDIG